MPEGIRWGRPAPWLAAAGGLCAVAAVAGMVTGALVPNEDGLLVVFLVGAVAAWAVPGTLIGRRRPANPIGLLLASEAFLIGAVLLMDQIAQTRPGSFVATFNADAEGYLVPMLLMGPFILLLFPNGRPPSRRWRLVAWLFLVSTVAGLIGLGLSPERDVPWSAAASILTTIAGVSGLVASALAIVSVVLRFRRSGGVERAQMRWLAIVAILGTLGLIIAIATGDEGEGSLLQAIGGVLFTLSLAVGLPAAIGVAVLRYRLWELDVVVKKTVLALILTLVIGVPVLLLLAASSQLLVWAVPDPIYTLVGGVALGLLIVPIVRLARRIATRLTFGKRATTYQVLTAFGERVGETYSTEDVLPRMAQLLASATGATSARVLLRLGGDLREEASTGPGSGEEHQVPVLHEGEELGALAATFPPSDPIDPAKRRLMEDLAAQAGLVLRNVRLIEELRASRQRLVAAQDEERRKLERNIHDGAQQQLVALSVQLKLLGTMVERDPAKARELADDLGQASTRALEDLRDLARGIYPPLLADKGLAAALESQARRAAVPTTVEADGIGRYDQDVESAVYFCALEALNNVAKYAQANSAEVRLAKEDGHLTFEIRDGGAGFDVDTHEHGTGLQGMADRLDAIGGTLEIRSTPGSGTSVMGRVPVGSENPS